ncbi:hypothetical protein Syun_016863 [Stephania yunnanensis]|uniref:Uncharacterized protein n=1 Tax=Stephania yunnanensis TaxID=152371 RepID=A0AAP0P5A6_9MAGN
MHAKRVCVTRRDGLRGPLKSRPNRAQFKIVEPEPLHNDGEKRFGKQLMQRRLYMRRSAPIALVKYVEAEIVQIEADDVPVAISNEVSKSQISMLVIGASSGGSFTRLHYITRIDQRFSYIVRAKRYVIETEKTPVQSSSRAIEPVKTTVQSPPESHALPLNIPLTAANAQHPNTISSNLAMETDFSTNETEGSTQPEDSGEFIEDTSMEIASIEPTNQLRCMDSSLHSVMVLTDNDEVADRLGGGMSLPNLQGYGTMGRPPENPKRIHLRGDLKIKRQGVKPKKASSPYSRGEVLIGQKSQKDGEIDDYDMGAASNSGELQC